MTRPVRAPFEDKDQSERLALFLGLLSVALSLVFVFMLASRDRIPMVEPVPIPDIKKVTAPAIDVNPIRDIPKRFRSNQRMPTRSEKASSGTLTDAEFHPEFDLIRIEDDRVWWESDNDDHTGDTEDDHLFHRSMEEPFLRLVHLVTERGAVLKVQDTYREEGVHHKRSLHKHGRAVDLTAKNMSLSELAKLSWAAGFDWVFFESPKKGGAHIHASMRAVPLRERVKVDKEE